jgi:hypothetical protein
MTSKKLNIIEEDKMEIGLLEENSMSAKVTYVTDEEMSNFFPFKMGSMDYWSKYGKHSFCLGFRSVGVQLESANVNVPL